MAHAWKGSYPVPSGWRAVCTCGHVSRGIDEAHVLDAHLTHANSQEPDQ